jgi:FkbM family methyltransferase
MADLKSGLRKLLQALHLGALYGVWRRLERYAPRRLWRQAGFRRWNRGADRQEIVVRPGLRLRIDPRSREPFEWFCFRSLEMARELDAFMRAMAARRRFLDIGACHGIFALAFAHRRPQVQAVAVEPSAVAFEILAENVRLGRQGNILARQLACGAAAGSLRMRQVWHHLEALPGEPAAGVAGAEPEGVTTVPMGSVDELCVELDFRPDLVKIDVEGYELAVLQGARATLAQHRPQIFLELHPDRLRQLGSSAAAVVLLLEALGYRFFDLRGRPASSGQVARRRSVSRIVCAAPAISGR